MEEKEIIYGHSLIDQMHEPELAQFVPPVKNMTDRRCEKCSHYATIDSGYGYCKRFPPKNIERKRYFRIKYSTEYPTVEWDRKACGEFEARK